ncbi:MAG: glycerophosphodiester phosphodiesterase [Gammaproteobacteria bacterium]|jgi:glycerophosphoryl diester phosphodiesterase|nr:glycerophosphodiester phosphodiesterase [Gammaproteobacteria bacterium]
MLHLPKLIGHRGVKGLAPENTLASFKKAKELGFSWVEFDVMLTACGEAIVFHDPLLRRTTNGKGRVARKTYAELSKLDAGTWFNSEFVNEPIPTLQQTIQCLAQLGLQANIEIKPTRGTDIATAQKTLEIIHEYWPQQLAKPLISSFSQLSLATVYALDSSLPLAMLYNKLPRDWKKTAEAFNCVSINLNQKYVTLAQITQIKQTGRLVLAYTVNDSQRAELLLDWGVDAVFTDYPLPNFC